MVIFFDTKNIIFFTGDIGIYCRQSARLWRILLFFHSLFFWQVSWSRARPRPSRYETETHKIRSRDLHHWYLYGHLVNI